ncbi:MAG: hypothetical protein ACM3H9_10780 [Rhodospirillaceae bacterium]
MTEGWVIRWMAAWPGAAAIGIANGAIREATYGRQNGEERANRLSGVTLVAALAIYFWNLQRRWPIPSTKDAVKIGAAWATLTVAFEFGFGWGVEKRSWKEMVAAYNVGRGGIWPLVLAWIGVGPTVVRRLQVGRR